MITIKKHTVQKAFKKLTMTGKQKEIAKKRKIKVQQAKRMKRKRMINFYGRTRYYLSLMFGEWILWAGRRRIEVK